MRVAVYAAPGLRPEDGELAARVRELADAFLARTVAARRYGYHATLKAPFRLRDGLTLEGDLVPAVAALAADSGPVVVPAVAPASMGGFWALTPHAPAPALHALADAVVTRLEPLRAELSADERARRRPERLAPRRRELLDRYGYPYVLDEFRFHLTLTDELAGAEHEAAGSELAAAFAPLLPADLPLSALLVFVEPEPGADFAVHSIHPLKEPR